MGRLVGNESFDKCTLVIRRVFPRDEVKRTWQAKNGRKHGSPMFFLPSRHFVRHLPNSESQTVL